MDGNAHTEVSIIFFVLNQNRSTKRLSFLPTILTAWFGKDCFKLFYFSKVQILPSHHSAKREWQSKETSCPQVHPVSSPLFEQTDSNFTNKIRSTPWEPCPPLSAPSTTAEYPQETPATAFYQSRVWPEGESGYFFWREFFPRIRMLHLLESIPNTARWVYTLQFTSLHVSERPYHYT